MGRSKAPSLPIKALSFCRPTELRGWQRNWIHRGAPRPANPVTCFPPGKVVAPATKGGHTGMIHEVYAALFFSPYLSFPLEGKCHVVAKGCTRLSKDMTLFHFPDCQSAAP